MMICWALLAGSPVFTHMTYASTDVPTTVSINADNLISKPLSGDNLVLRGFSTEGVHQVCPQVVDASHQPFCRKFNSPMLDACGYDDMIYLVLANGDIHQVNNALIGVYGGFDAAYQPDQKLDLYSAWMVQKSCKLESGLPEVLAVDEMGNVMHFNGNSWRIVGVVITGFVRN
jgi:hypothetical protein